MFGELDGTRQGKERLLLSYQVIIFFDKLVLKCMVKKTILINRSILFKD